MSRFTLATALALALALALSALPAAAQQAPETPFQMPRADDPAPGAPSDEAPAGSVLEGFLMELFDRAQPHLEGLAEDMGGLMEEYRPMLDDLGRLMDDIGNYELPPERLANGDILIRRKPGAPPPPPVENLMPRSPGALPPGHPPLSDPPSPPPLLPQIEL